MKIWHSTLATGPVISFGKSSGGADEDYFEGAPQEFDHEFYEDIDPSAPALVRKSQSAIDTIIAQRVQDAADAAQAKADRIQEITDKLTGMTPSQLNTYIDNNVTDLASARTYLKRLTLIVRHLAIEQEDEQ